MDNGGGINKIKINVTQHFWFTSVKFWCHTSVTVCASKRVESRNWISNILTDHHGFHCCYPRLPKSAQLSMYKYEALARSKRKQSYFANPGHRCDRSLIRLIINRRLEKHNPQRALVNEVNTNQIQVQHGCFSEHIFGPSVWTRTPRPCFETGTKHVDVSETDYVRRIKALSSARYQPGGCIYPQMMAGFKKMEPKHSKQPCVLAADTTWDSSQTRAASLTEPWCWVGN